MIVITRSILSPVNLGPHHLFVQIDRYVDMDAVASTAIDLWERPILEGMSGETRKELGF